MKQLTKLLAAVSAVCVMASAHCATALAAKTSLPDGFLIDDDNGISINNGGDYCLYSDDLQPGDVITRTLTIRNLEQGDPFCLYLFGDSPRSEGPVDWLDNLHLQIILDGRTYYAGRLRGDGRNTHSMQGNGANLIHPGLDLGVFQKGDYGVLEFVVTTDAGHMTREELSVASSANIDWVFKAVKELPPDAPKTGDALRGGIYILLISLGFLCAVFYKKYRKLRGA